MNTIRFGQVIPLPLQLKPDQAQVWGAEAIRLKPEAKLVSANRRFYLVDGLDAAYVESGIAQCDIHPELASMIHFELIRHLATQSGHGFGAGTTVSIVG